MTGLLIVNLTVADQFPWVVFPLVGWDIGLTLQYLLGLRWVSRSIVERQVMVEELAAATKRRTGGAQAGHPPPG